MITFHTLNHVNQKEAQYLSVCESQKHWIETFNQILLDQINRAYDIDWHIQLIYFNDVLIGYFMYGINPNQDLWLDRFMIDCKHQNKGYGFLALNHLITYFSNTYPHIKNLYLSIKPNHIIAIKLYEKIGFIKTNHLDGDEIVYVKKIHQR